MARRFVLRLTHAVDDVERIGVALTVGSTAIASGIDVELWLVHDAVSLGEPGLIETLRLEHSPPLAELWETIEELVKAARFCDAVFAVGDYTLKEMRFLGAEFMHVNMQLAYNGVPCFPISVSEKMAMWAQKLGLANFDPNFADPLGALKKHLNIKDGFDAKGEVAVAIYFAEGGGFDVAARPAFLRRHHQAHQL